MFSPRARNPTLAYTSTSSGHSRAQWLLSRITVCRRHVRLFTLFLRRYRAKRQLVFGALPASHRSSSKRHFEHDERRDVWNLYTFQTAKHTRRNIGPRRAVFASLLRPFVIYQYTQFINLLKDVLRIFHEKRFIIN